MMPNVRWRLCFNTIWSVPQTLENLPICKWKHWPGSRAPLIQVVLYKSLITITMKLQAHSALYNGFTSKEIRKTSDIALSILETFESWQLFSFSHIFNWFISTNGRVFKLSLFFIHSCNTEWIEIRYLL